MDYKHECPVRFGHPRDRRGCRLFAEEEIDRLNAEVNRVNEAEDLRTTKE